MLKKSCKCVRSSQKSQVDDILSCFPGALGILDTSNRFHPRTLRMKPTSDNNEGMHSLSMNKTLAPLEDCDAQQSQHATSSAMAHMMH